MRPVYQTRPDGKTGDCLNACIASLLELDLRDLPDFAIYEDSAEWWKAAQDACYKFGFQLWRVELTQHVAFYYMPAQPLVILVGPSVKNGVPHTCVGYASAVEDSREVSFTIIHDPLGGDEGLRSVDAIMFLVPVNPAAMSAMRVTLDRIHGITESDGCSQRQRLDDIGALAGSWRIRRVDVNEFFEKLKEAEDAQKQPE